MAGRDITIPLSAIPEEFDFVVLGHIHKAQDFGKYGRPNVFYCGSTDRIDFGEESEEKSYVVMDLDNKTWERVPIPCRKYITLSGSVSDAGIWSNDSVPLPDVKDAICRIRIKRSENAKPNYDAISSITNGCFDFRGFTEDVQRTASIRSEEIVKAESLPDLLKVWHECKQCDVNLEDLTHSAQEMERQVAL